MRHNKYTYPGQTVLELCLKPLNLSIADGAKALRVSRNTLSELIHGHRGISADMAERLSVVFGADEKFWHDLQVDYDIWVQKNKKNKIELYPYHKKAS